ncbi:endothelin-converting enzyme 2-like isoform X1 [Ornithodoros turicata]|uniref:endothelin-converting enzyme 2-like isoform X1 n=1 Tax=Ornithodoros turicata TaxID=34597 RepID=UPI003138A459
MDDTSNLLRPTPTPRPAVRLKGPLNRTDYAAVSFCVSMTLATVLFGFPRVVDWIATLRRGHLEKALLWHSPYYQGSLLNVHRQLVDNFPRRRYDLIREIIRSLDRNADPCNDFFDFVCGRWTSAHPGMVSEFTRLQGELIAAAVYKMVRGKRKRRSLMSASDLAGEAVRSCLLIHIKKHEDDSAFRHLLESLNFNWPNVREGLKLDLLDVAVATALDWGIPTLFDLEVATDLRSDNSNILRLSVSSILSTWVSRWYTNATDAFGIFRLPGYLDPDMDYKVLVNKVIEPTIQALLRLLPGHIEGNAKPAYIRVKDITRVSRRYITTDRFTWTVNKHLPKNVSLKMDNEIHLLDYNFFWHIGEYINKFESEHRQSDVAVLIGWVLASHMAPALTYRVYSETPYGFSLATFSCISLVAEMAPYPLTWFMTEDYVVPQNWNKTKRILEDVRAAMADSFGWMDDASRWSALQRLKLIRQIVAYPDTVSTKSGLDGRYGYLHNTIHGPFGLSYLKTKQVSRTVRNAQLSRPAIPRQEDDWLAVPLVNAMFVPFYHVVIIPTTIMLPPFLVTDLPVASYGGLGHVLAHELSHAFDTGGSIADADGLQREWYTTKTRSSIQDNEKCLRALYKVPGNESWSTKNEDFADSLGMKVATRALERRFETDAFSGVEAFSNMQLFFVSSCFKWCGADAEEGPQDTHSGTRRRCNAPLHGQDKFLKAFNCGPYARMRPTKPCHFAS